MRWSLETIKNRIFWVYKNVFAISMIFLGFANWNSSHNWNWHVSLFATSHVCLYSKHIRATCVFLTVFPTMVKPFEPSLCFFLLFSHFSSVFCYWIFSLMDFSSLWKRFILYFSWIFSGPVGGRVLVVGPVMWVHKTHKQRAPNTQYINLIFNSWRFHLQLTTKSAGLFRCMIPGWPLSGSFMAP